MEEKIGLFIANHNAWRVSDNTLVATKEFPNFTDAIKFVNDVATIAEKHNHHPDILIEYNKVTLTLTTHDAGSTVTEKDLAVAQAVENL